MKGDSILKKIFLAIIVISFLIGETSALTWQDVVSRASEYNYQVKSAQKLRDAYRWSYYKAYSPLLPQVSASLSMGNSANASGTSNSYSYGISATQSLFKGMGNYFNIRSAAVNFEYYRASLQNTEADVYSQARQAFIELYVAQQNIKVREKIRQSRSDNARMIKLFYDSGKEDKGNYLRTQAQLADAENSVVSALRQLDLAKLKLAQLIGSDLVSAEGDPMVAVAPLLPDFDALLKNSPAFLMASYQLELADINQQETLSGFLPSVSLNASLQNSGSSWPPSASSRSLSLSVSLPIFPGGSNIADRVIYGLMLEKAREDFARSQKDMYYTINQEYENFKDEVEGYGVQKKYLDASSERARIAQSKYLNGLITYNEWDQIQNEYISNQTNLLNYNKSALIAEANWHKAYGGYVK